MVSELIRTRQWATEAGTARFVRRHDRGKGAHAYRDVAKMRLSALGIGTSLGDADDATDAQQTAAIVEAVRQGINVIDTASSYRQGRAERCVGAAIERLIELRECFRSELLIASKVGYVTAATAAHVPDGHLVTTAHADRGHCLHPEFIAASLERTLASLGRPTVDVYLLHNPEVWLPERGREVLYDALRGAFAALERAGDDGKLRAYGIATWRGLQVPEGDPLHLDLRAITDLARDVAGTRHRCRAVQTPVPREDAGNTGLQRLAQAAELGMVTFGSSALQRGELCTDPGPEQALRDAIATPGLVTAIFGSNDVGHIRTNVRALAASG